MAQATVELPNLLAPFVDGDAVIEVDSDTIGDALRAAVQRHPALQVHFFDERGGLRQHLLCLHNGANVRWSGLDEKLNPGDVIRIYQAVSGG